MAGSMTVGKRFAIATGSLVAMLTIFAIIAIVSFRKIDAGVDSLATDSIPGIYYSEAIQSELMSLRGDFLRHMMEKNPEQIAKVEARIADDWKLLEEALKGYDGSISEDVDRQQFERLKATLPPIQQGWEKVYPISKAGKTEEAYRLYMGIMSEPIISVRKQAEDLVDWNKKRADVTVTSASRVASVGWQLTIASAIFAISTGIVLSWFMILALKKQLVRAVSELSDGAEQIASAAMQVSASSQSLAQGSSEQAASLEEVSASSEEINSMARKNTDNSRSMAQLVSQWEQMFSRTNHQLEEMVMSMDEITQSSDKISKIIKVIDEIAFQTNILALNAAVEAARAGEAGMGFAVVADEVRNLAQRSAQAAKDTAALIEESIARSNDGKAKVDQVAAAIRGITTDSNKIKILVDEVTLGSEEQSRGFEQIAKAISQMEQVTQTAAANAEEGAAAAEEMNAQSETLKDVVVGLKALVTQSSETGRGERLNSTSALLGRHSLTKSGSAQTSRPAGKLTSALVESHALPVKPEKRIEEARAAFPLEASFREF